jgi:hypothetical protein
MNADETNFNSDLINRVQEEKVTFKSKVTTNVGT